MTDQIVSIPASIGELIDKITILEIKSERIKDEAKQVNIRRELGLLRDLRRRLPHSDPRLDELTRELKLANERLWDLEDAIRDCERERNFGDAFVQNARQIYRANDNRMAIKRSINLHVGSQIVEEKSYSDY